MHSYCFVCGQLGDQLKKKTHMPKKQLITVYNICTYVHDAGEKFVVCFRCGKLLFTQAVQLVLRVMQQASIRRTHEARHILDFLPRPPGMSELLPH